MFDTILIANRGEIACRIIRTAKALGLKTVAVYSQADAGAPHVQMADTAVAIGPARASQSYLCVERILEAAQLSGAGAVHPGYGFLSENAGFAQAVVDAGLTFIGPPASAIEVMGNKARAKAAMEQAGIACVPGYRGEQSNTAMAAAAWRIGFPVMIKAAAGGGGRGMRLVGDPQALEAALASARSEALNAFGSDELILEKAIGGARHVEIQIFADGQGGVIHFGERDCSVQRRHQKVIEEMPSPVMTPALRDAMGEAAVNAARAVNYSGAGTVEFLLGDAGEFHFLEMNTRLQVEHPVTEMVTGLDLVALQIAVAQGAPLGLSQTDIRFDGHAIEARLYAEDPAGGFLPSTGKILCWEPPQGPGIRVDSGIAQGQMVSPHYDPMLAKIIAHGASRQEARLRLASALRETVVLGPATNRAFLIACLEAPAFANGEATTGFIGENFGSAFAGTAPSFLMLGLAALGRFLSDREAALASAPAMPQALIGWSSLGALQSRLSLIDGPMIHALAVCCTGGQIEISDGAQALVFEHGELRGDHLAFVVAGANQRGRFCRSASGVHVQFDGQSAHFKLAGASGSGASDGGSSGVVTAPMHGRIVEIMVREGEGVAAGDALLILEAMKMQHRLTSPVAGLVKQLPVRAGQQVAAGDLVAQIETAGDA